MIPLKQSDTEIRKTQTKESLCVYFENKSPSLNKLVAFNKNAPLIKEEIIPDSSHKLIENSLIRKIITMKNNVSENLTKSKSLPILKSEMSNNIFTNFKAIDVSLISESSFAREKKMSMIVKRMASLISATVLTSDTTINYHAQQYEARKVESRTMPIPCVRLWALNINESSSLNFIMKF